MGFPLQSIVANPMNRSNLKLTTEGHKLCQVEERTQYISWMGGGPNRSVGRQPSSCTGNIEMASIQNIPLGILIQ